MAGPDLERPVLEEQRRRLGRRGPVTWLHLRVVELERYAPSTCLRSCGWVAYHYPNAIAVKAPARTGNPRMAILTNDLATVC